MPKPEIRDGTIHSDLNAAGDMIKVVSKPDPDQNGWHWEVAGTIENIRSEIQSRVTKQLNVLKTTLRGGVEG